MTPTLNAGESYHIEIRTEFDTAVAAVALVNKTLRFDNIALRVDDTRRVRVGTDRDHRSGDEHHLHDSGGPRGARRARRRSTAGRTPRACPRRTRSSTAPARRSRPSPGNPTTIGPFNAGDGIDLQPRDRTVGGLLSCTTYYFRIAATNWSGPAPAPSCR